MLLTKDIESITIDDIKRFIDRPKVEQQTIELKKVFEKHGAGGRVVDKVAERILLSIVAFGNTWGGVVLVGVDDDGRRNPQDEIVGVDYKAHHYDQVRDLIWSRIRPPLPFEIRHIPFESEPSRCVWLIRVNRSPRLPHEYVSPDANRIFFKQRHADTNRDMNLQAIEYLLQERSRNQESLNTAIENNKPLKESNVIEIRAVPLQPRRERLLRPELERAIRQYSIDHFMPGLRYDQFSEDRTRTSYTLKVFQEARESQPEPNIVTSVTCELDGSLCLRDWHQAYGQNFDIERFIRRLAEFVHCYRDVLKHMNHQADSYFYLKIGWAGVSKKVVDTEGEVGLKRADERLISPEAGHVQNLYSFRDMNRNPDPFSLYPPITVQFHDLHERIENETSDLYGCFLRELGLPFDSDSILRIVAYWLRRAEENVSFARNIRQAPP
ncbi:MAG: ATP-binding protein [Planctomycetota bacterium]|nr:ATP-binding protein [Planctomycetota bacterium]